jgi:ribonuclease Z
MCSLKVTLLGTGLPDPRPDRYGTSTLVEAGKERLIIDCGRCTLQRLSETGTPLKEANKLFLTHLHSDHTVGIPDLWLTPWIFGRWEEPFYVWGPVGTKSMMSKLGAQILTQEIQEGVVYENNGVKVTAFEVDHRPIIPSYGYRVDYEESSVVLSGDTRYSENLIKFAENTDLLIHNVGAARKEDLKVSERYRRIMALHLPPEEAGEVFTRVRPKLAVYTHMTLFRVEKDEIIKRTRKSYNGPMEIGEDLMAFEIRETVKILRPQDNSSLKGRQEIVPDL